jgi:hypothetical protein
MSETPAPPLPPEPDPIPDEDEDGDDRAVAEDTEDRWPAAETVDLERRRRNVEQLLRGDDRWRS